jgi:hypothetical protein
LCRTTGACAAIAGGKIDEHGPLWELQFEYITEKLQLSWGHRDGEYLFTSSRSSHLHVHFYLVSFPFIKMSNSAAADISATLADTPPPLKENVDEVEDKQHEYSAGIRLASIMTALLFSIFLVSSPLSVASAILEMELTMGRPP